MNRIIIDKNSLVNYKDNAIEISDNKIIFKANGDYVLEYINSNLIGLEIEVLDDILVKLFIISCDNDIVIKNHYKIGNSSSLRVFKFYYNDNVDENVIIDLDGENSFVSYNFSSIIKNDEEYHIIVNHNHNKVSSKISNKCIGLDGSKIKIQIDSILDKGNSDCVMDQNSRILTIGDVDATIIPNMFIEEDSVEAKHGSVVGKISPEDIFYLMSRGIREEEAINLLIKGLIVSNLDVDMDARARIFQIIQKLWR